MKFALSKIKSIAGGHSLLQLVPVFMLAFSAVLSARMFPDLHPRLIIEHAGFFQFQYGDDYAYIACDRLGNGDSSYLYIIDTRNKQYPQIASKIAVGDETTDISSICYDNQKVFLAHPNAVENAGVSKIDVTDKEHPHLDLHCLQAYPKPFYGITTAYNTSQNKNVLFVSNYYRTNTLQTFDPNTNEQLGFINTNGFGRDLVVTSDGKRAFQTTSGLSIYVYDVEDPSNPLLIDTIAEGFRPYKIAITPDDKYLYVTCNSAGSGGVDAIKILDITDPHNAVIIATIPHRYAESITLDYEGKRLFSAHYNDVIDPQISAVDISDPTNPTLIDSVFVNYRLPIIHYADGYLHYAENVPNRYGYFGILAVGQAPRANDQDLVTNEDEAKSFTLSASDPDDDSLTFVINEEPENGSLSGTAPELTYTPNDNYYGTDEFTYTVSDEFMEATATVTISVMPVSDAPEIPYIEDKTVAEGSLLQFTVTVEDTDDDVLAISANGLPAGASFMDGVFNWTPGYDQAGTYNVYFSANDQDHTVTRDVTITVTNVNRAPVADAQSVVTDEDESVAITLTGSDPDGEELTYTVDAAPANGTLSGTAPDLTYTPDENFNGTDQLTFSVTDGDLTDEATVSIQIDAVNDAPVLDAIAAQSVEENATLEFTATASDVDGDELSFSAAGLPQGAAFEAGTFSWKPGFDQAGSYTVTVTVTDGSLEDEQDVTITVTNVNRAPVADAQ
ncbi:MAG: Ig-like domain-containing protein, partial [Chitinispirillaceae bacterium]